MKRQIKICKFLFKNSNRNYQGCIRFCKKLLFSSSHTALYFFSTGFIYRLLVNYNVVLVLFNRWVTSSYSLNTIFNDSLEWRYSETYHRLYHWSDLVNILFTKDNFLLIRTRSILDKLYCSHMVLLIRITHRTYH